MKPIPSARLIRVMEQLIEIYGKPHALRMDKGGELTSDAFTEWSLRAHAASNYTPGSGIRNIIAAFA